MMARRLVLSVFSVLVWTGMITCGQAADGAQVEQASNTTILIEGSPEYYADSKSGSYDKGELASYYLKAGLSHMFEGGVTLGGTFQHTIRQPDESSGTSSYSQAEFDLGYKLELLPPLTVTASGVLGYGFGEEPKIDPHDPDRAAAYYAVKLGVDLKLVPELTWNVVEIRYRDAFNYTWKTPKIQTGLTYSFDPRTAIYTNVGKSWKDDGSKGGYKPDRINFALGVKYSF
jgi:hypothetical protein